MLKKTQQEFINELKKVFGEKYDLTNVEYNGYLIDREEYSTKSKSKIIKK